MQETAVRRREVGEVELRIADPSVDFSPAEINLSDSGACRSIASDYEKRAHVHSIARGEVPPIVIISGHSGSGKSFIAEELQESGFIPSSRYITRPRRESDSANDLPWDSNRNQPVFAYTKYDEHYGFPAREIVNTLKQGLGSTIICGDLGKVAPLVESLSSLVPLVPVIVIRLEVPLSIAQQRLTQERSEAYPGESEIRNYYNRILEGWENKQVADLKAFYDLHTVVNLSPIEHNRQTYEREQLKPLTPELLHKLLAGFKEDSVNSSKLIAEEILEKKYLNYDQRGVSNSIVAALDEHLVPLCESRGLSPVLKGGLAVAAYLLNATSKDYPMTMDDERKSCLTFTASPTTPIDRTVSPDIDWTMIPSSRNISSYQEVLSDINGSPVNFKRNSNKAVFNSDKASAQINIDGEVIELDAIAMSRVKPDKQNFTFDFKYDSLVHHQHRELTLPSGRTVQVVPPEFLVMEKLCAGRGEELGKLDLFDSASLLVTQALDKNLLQRLINAQKFNTELDGNLDLKSPPPVADSATRLRDAGIQDQKLLNIVLERLLLSRQETIHDGMKFQWTPDAIKQIAFLDSLLTSIDKIEQAALKPEGSALGKKLMQSFTEIDLMNATSAFRRFVYYYASYQVGRSDIFVRRSHTDSFSISDARQDLR